MTLCAERACKDCGTIFEPPAHPGWAIVAIGMGAGMCVMLLSDKVPTIYHALRPFSLGRILKESIYLLGLLWIGIQIVFVGWKGLRRREPRIVR